MTRTRYQEFAREILIRDGIRKAGTTGFMVGFFVDPEVAEVLELPHAETDLHLTLAYCGKVADLDRAKIEVAVRSLKALCAETDAIIARISGLGRFNVSSTSEGQDVLVALVDAPGLHRFRQQVVDILALSGVPAREDHDFTPHITLQYLQPDQIAPIDRIGTTVCVLSWLTVAYEGRRLAYPMRWVVEDLTKSPVEKYSEDQARDEEGRWTDGGGGGGDVSETASGGGPQRSAPPKKTWKDPPKPQGKGSGKAGGYAANGKTNTEIGDAAESALAKDMDLHNMHPDQRQGKFDLKYDSTNQVFEVKTCTTSAKEYKIKMKGKELREKKAYAKKHGLTPGSMIVVMDTKKGELHTYWRPQLGNFRLRPGASGPSGKDGWNFAGTTKLRKK